MLTRRIALAFVVLALLACSGAESATVAVPPTSTTLGPASEPLVAFEASWLCQVQRFAFAEVADIDSELVAALEAEGSSAAEYADFKARLDDTPELRTEIRERFEAQCAASEPVSETES